MIQTFTKDIIVHKRIVFFVTFPILDFTKG
jgi:hypothetical protein